MYYDTMKRQTYGNEKFLATKKKIQKMGTLVLRFYYQLSSIELFIDDSFSLFEFFSYLYFDFHRIKMSALKCLICDFTVKEGEETNNLRKESITAIVSASIERCDGKWKDIEEIVLPQVVHSKCRKRLHQEEQY